MKIAKFFAGMFGTVGAVLLAGSIALCLMFRSGPVYMDEFPAGAVQCSDVLAYAISQKDFASVEQCLYGRPGLDMAGTPEDPMAAAVWKEFNNSFSFSYQGDCYAEEAGIFRDATVTYLEVASVTENLQTRAHALLTQKVETATDMAQLYGEDGQFRQDLVDQVLTEALEQAIREDARQVTETVTVELVHREGRWWAIPDTALLTALSGGLA